MMLLQDFLSGRAHSVVVDGIRSENVMIVSGDPQGSELGPYLFFYTLVICR